jgi:hypothetical protein
MLYYCTTISSTVTFPLRINYNSSATIDNILADTAKFEKFIVSPLTNGLSDHNAQIIAVHMLQGPLRCSFKPFH